MYFKEIENYEKHDEEKTFVLESEECEKIFATWDETRKCYDCYISWMETNDIEGEEENEEYHCGSFWKTDGDLKKCTIKDIIERGKDVF